METMKDDTAYVTDPRSVGEIIRSGHESVFPHGMATTGITEHAQTYEVHVYRNDHGETEYAIRRTYCSLGDSK